MLAEKKRWWVVGKQGPDGAFSGDEFTRLNKRFLAEIIAPIQNKVGRCWMSAPLAMSSAGEEQKLIRASSWIEAIFIANLSKGRLGEDKANLLDRFW